MARRAGLNDNIKPTPAVALGAYEATPLEIAGAYTMFADGGNYVKPAMLALVRSPEGQVLYRHSPEARPALDPRVAYLMVNLLEEVLRSGTGAGARARGFRVPAAGKTGTSHDGWFAGFTSQLLCVVWVGFDDDRQLNLEGAKSALPIWTEFMKRALEYRGYRDAKKFPVPSGVASVNLCAESAATGNAGMLHPDTRSISWTGASPRSTAPGSAWTESVYAFSYYAGFNPTGITVGRGGAVLYGVTSSGNRCGGYVFELSPPSSTSSWKESVLASQCTGLANPWATPVVGPKGILYVASIENYGSIFSLTPPSPEGGPWTVSAIQTFNGRDGDEPNAVAVGESGALYGTTVKGGTASPLLGTVYSLTPRLRLAASGSRTSFIASPAWTVMAPIPLQGF
jgi:hypothetical protein